MRDALKRISSLLYQKHGELELATTEIRKRGYSLGFKSTLDPDSSDEEEVTHCRFARESIYNYRQGMWIETSLI